MGAPRITIGDGSLYIRTARLLSWEISEDRLLSPQESLRLNRVRISVNGDAYASKLVHNSIVIAIGDSTTLDVRVVPKLSRKLCISLEGETSFFDGHWRAIGDQTIFYDAPGVHIQRVIVDGEICYEAPAELLHDAPPLRRGFRHESGCRLEITVASASRFPATKTPVQRPNRLKRKRAAA